MTYRSHDALGLFVHGELLRRCAVLALLLALSACGSGTLRRPGRVDAGVDGGGAVDARVPGGFRCVDCLSSADCGGDSCIQYGGDVACAGACGPGGACASDSVCQTYTTTNGAQATVCVPIALACGAVQEDDAGAPPPPPPVDAGTPTSCGTRVGPTVASCCTSCTVGATDCQANGCYGGWWCDTATCRCGAPPVCGEAPDAGVVDAGPPPTGSVTASGGTVSRLFFAVVGDTRPANPNDTAHYPSDVIGRIYTDLQALSPRPQFAISTGDYCFADAWTTEAAAQLRLYAAARALYSGPAFPALGNHECTGRTTSNCGAGALDGVTANYTEFMSQMLAPIGQSKPYYVIRIDATDGSWTSKLVVTAPNAWSTAQETWFRTTMAVPTTYSFVIRHEPGATLDIPALPAIDAILATVPYTLIIVGHSHLYSHHTSAKEVVMGLGGAPATGPLDYGYLTVTQDASGDLTVAEFDYLTGARNASFKIHANGSPAP
jgi:hypothetical protein